MEGLEIGVKEKFVNDATKRGDEVLIFSNKGDYVFNPEGFNFTRVTNAKLIVDGKLIPLERTSTWAGLLRSVNTATKESRDKIDVAGDVFNDTIRDVVEEYDLAMNNNFSMTLFDDDSFINSSLYKNNQNHALNVWRDKKICAVYSGEVVVILNALIASSGENDENVTLLVSYCKREQNLNDQAIYIVSKREINNLIHKRVKEILSKYKFNNSTEYEAACKLLIKNIYKKICDRNIFSVEELESDRNRDIFEENVASIIHRAQAKVKEMENRNKGIVESMLNQAPKRIFVEKIKECIESINIELELVDMYLKKIEGVDE